MGSSRKMWIVQRSSLGVPPRWLRNSGVESLRQRETSPCRLCPSDLDRLGDEIAELAAHLDAAIARLLDLIREFDARAGWNNGFRSCAAWLTWRVGLSPGAAREHVRVARALGTLPRLAQALARGELSYAKVRALTRVATPATEERLLAVGRAGTAEHVERIVRGWRRVDRKAEAQEAARQQASRALHVYPNEDGTVRDQGQLTPEVGALLIKALDAARETLYQRGASRRPVSTRPRSSSSRPTPWRSSPRRRSPRARSRRPGRAVSGRGPRGCRGAGRRRSSPGQSVLEDGLRVPAGTSQRLACDASRVVMRHDADGQIVEVGARTGRFPPRCGGRSSIGTRAVAFPAAGCASARAITSVTGRRAAPPRSRISPCLSPAPPRGPRGGLPARSTAGRRARFRRPNGRVLPEVPSAPDVRGDPVGGPSPARGGWARPARADRDSGLAGGAPGRGLRHRRAASVGQVGAEE